MAHFELTAFCLAKTVYECSIEFWSVFEDAL